MKWPGNRSTPSQQCGYCAASASPPTSSSLPGRPPRVEPDQGRYRRTSPCERRRALAALIELGHLDEALALVEELGHEHFSRVRLAVADRCRLLGDIGRTTELLSALAADEQSNASDRRTAKERLAGLSDDPT